MPTDPPMAGWELRMRYPGTKMANLAVVRPLFADQVAGVPDRNLVAFSYPSAEAAEQFAIANAVHYGHVSYHTVTDGGVFGIIDMSAQLEQWAAESRRRRAALESDDD